MSDDWRETLLQQGRNVMLGLLAFSVIMVSTPLARSTELRIAGVGLCILLLAAFWLSRPAMPQRVRAAAVIGVMPLGALGFYPVIGFNPGTVLAIALSLVLAGLLLGRNAIVYLVAIMVVYLLTLSALLWTGMWTGPLMLEVDRGSPQVWLRTTLVSVVFWAGISFSVLFVVNTLEGTSRRRQQALLEKEAALEDLKKEQVQRQAAENARRDAEILAQQAQKLDALGQLAAGVAHDFNNALLVIQGWTEFLRDPKSPEQRDKAINAIAEATEHAEELAQQLLTFGRKELRAPEVIDLTDVVDSSMKTLSRVLAPNLVVRTTMTPEGHVFADRSQLQQLIYNLVLNARDAVSDRGQIDIRTSIAEALPTHVSEASAGKGPWVVLEVEDNGSGISPAILDRIFEPFFTTKEVGKGTGLGLSTVFGIVQQSGGHINVQSGLNQGSCFRIYLPARQPAPGTARKKPVARPKVSGARILVVEDDPLARDLLCVSLRDAGYEIAEAADGNEALTLLGKQSFDLLCSDAVFPGAPLLEVIRVFEQASPEAPVLICSGYVPEDLAIDGIASGQYAFLPKPFTASELVHRIEELLTVGD
ncbi:MAG: ATP-binding protein [Xanthomonadales bacterium]|nr:ATP-binding protein [Xanthomonadales bacterium]